MLKQNEMQVFYKLFLLAFFTQFAIITREVRNLQAEVITCV